MESNRAKRDVRQYEGARSETIAVNRTTTRERAQLRVLYPKWTGWRPATRGDCKRIVRPCPYVACKYNLYLDVSRGGSVKLNFPDIEPDQMEFSCALDVADSGDSTCEFAGFALNVTRERARQIEIDALLKLKCQRRYREEHADTEMRNPATARRFREEPPLPEECAK